jgi:hypothetical protein
MEQAICWPARYLRSWPQLVRAVQAVVVARSRDSDTDGAARKLSSRRLGYILGPHLIRSGRSEYSQSMRNARWVYQGDIGLPLRFGRFQ